LYQALNSRSRSRPASEIEALTTLQKRAEGSFCVVCCEMGASYARRASRLGFFVPFFLALLLTVVQPVTAIFVFWWMTAPFCARERLS
jgi:hypothetical protein